jgi:hypothetical protein
MDMESNESSIILFPERCRCERDIIATKRTQPNANKRAKRKRFQPKPKPATKTKPDKTKKQIQSETSRTSISINALNFLLFVS